MTALDIIRHFYPDDTPLRRLLLTHSMQVRDRALQIMAMPCNQSLGLNASLVSDGAMLHDIGISRCDAPGIHCHGTEPYLCHGVIGAQMLRHYAEELFAQGMIARADDLEPFARICERHTGSGLSCQDIMRQQLPITPPRDLLPVTLEEQLVCLADKFFSKSGDPAVAKAPERVALSMMKFGADAWERYVALCQQFGLEEYIIRK